MSYRWAIKRCGEYDAVSYDYVDEFTTYYYDASGKLVGKHEFPYAKKSACTAYDRDFVPPGLICTQITPGCTRDAGSAEDAGG